MKPRILVSLLVFLPVLLVISACSPAAQPQPLPTSTTTHIVEVNLPAPASTHAVPTHTPPAALHTVTPPPPTAAPTATPTTVNLIPLPSTLSGVVQDAAGPLAGAIVQVQGTPNQTLTSKDGRFILAGISGTTPINITAWSEGFYVGWVNVNPSAPGWTGGGDLSITLKPLPEKDNAKYPWFSFDGVTGSASCGLCHREYTEWKRDAHSQAAQNPRFLSVYNGTDVQGNQSPPTQWGSNGSALPPDSSQPYYGVGFRLDTPNRAGNCATCHTPVASKVPNQKNCGWSGCHTDLTIERSNGVIDMATLPIGLSGDGLEGVTCDFCHKVGDVILDPHTGLPKPDMPGILSMRLYRPEEGQQVFFGTLVDVNRRVSYLPLETESEFCAPCHYGVFGGVVGVGSVSGGTTIYNSYGEWLDSPYSDPKTGQSCQDCHMLVSDAHYYVFPDKGGLVREYTPLHNHTMPGATDETLLKNAVTLKAAAKRVAGQVKVDVSLTNDKTGHSVPTDAPIRQMILVVEALDASGKPLPLKSGLVNPTWAGNFAGQPGKTYMKVLRDEWTGETPTTAYWRPITVVEDMRLAALATDTQQFLFDLPAGSAATINVRVIFRRSYQELAQQKGWTDPDILMQIATISIEK